MGKLSGKSLLASMAHSVSFSTSHRHEGFSTSSFNSDHSSSLVLRFETRLADRLSSLNTTDSTRVSANLNWLLDALAVANSTQTSLVSLLPQLSQNKDKLLQSLESAVGLLDVCNALKDAIAEIQDYLARLQKGLKNLSQSVTISQNSARLTQAAAVRLQICVATMEAANRKRWQSRLEDACRSLKLFKKQIQMQKNTTDCDNLMHLVDEATLTIAVILSAMASSFSSAPKQRKLSRNHSSVVSGMSCLLRNGPLKTLQKDLAHEDTCGTVFQELEGLHVAALALQHVSHEPVITKLAAEALIKKAKEMEQSLAELSPKLDGLFHAMSAARLHVLS